ncbi:MAG: hypothetical protein HQK81_06665 [Desulfovibrionaceae bacterium]|nr:hypothetical protein [Desulfovibrionaceae bacterium]MBF0513732.1 hypothetical protein [Desulfovibrionaceae bacterium]
MKAARDDPPDGGMGPGGAKFLFRSFQRILTLNTAVLERMAQMDRALGGEYVFDKAFLESAVRDVCSLTHRVAYQLNGMAGEGYVALYDAYLAVKDALEDVLSGGMGPLSARRTLAFDEIGWEMEPLAGLASVGLAVLGRKMRLPAPDGLAVTVTGMRALAGQDRGAAKAALAEIKDAVAALYFRLGGARTLELSLIAAGTDKPGQILASSLADSPEQAAAAVQAFAASSPADARLAVCLRPKIKGPVEGSLATLAQSPGLPPAMLVHASPPEGPPTGSRFFISRIAPYELVSDGRDGPWPVPRTAARLAELGLAAERALGGPCLLSFALDPGGSPWLTGVEPLVSPFTDSGEDDPGQPGEPEQALLAGGQIACAGVAAGPVVLLGADTAPASVPPGSVGVAKTSVPALATIVPRLAALLTEIGTAASHLATVARENRVPAVFGLKGATSLAPGTMVTVDADEPAVYPGVSASRLRQAASQENQLRDEPEYQTLRRLLRHVRPLNLIDPQASDFTPERCRTCHDIIHFAHEKAVELLLSIDAAKGAGRNGAGSPRRLREDAPFVLSILDMGGGLAAPSGACGKNRDVGLAEVTSRPLKAFLDGLLLPAARRQEPGRLSLGDVFGGLGRTNAAMSGPAGLAGLNLALAASDYANITMRLGYHFSVVDAVVSDRPEHTFIYFRFAGGFADGDRRARRAKLILAILDRLGFSATLKGDLVVGKRKLMEAGEALTVLRILGALSAYTRQLDIELGSDAAAERLAGEFLAASGLDGQSPQAAS